MTPKEYLKENNPLLETILEEHNLRTLSEQFAGQYAQQKVIEELENILKEKDEVDTERVLLDVWYSVDAEIIEDRIKELKQ